MKYLILFCLLSLNGISPSNIMYSIDNKYISPYDQEFLQKLEQVIDFKVGDKITLDSPKRFLQISILFTMAQNANYAKITQKKNVSDDEIGNFLNTQRTKFYNKLGISENEYINYSVNYSPEIEEFLETNVLFAEIYGIVQSQVTD